MLPHSIPRERIGKQSMPVPRPPDLPPIHTIRRQRVVLDSDLARLYGVPTFRFNEAIKRNVSRFPEDFRFQLTPEEFARLISQIAISNADATDGEIDPSELIAICDEFTQTSRSSLPPLGMSLPSGRHQRLKVIRLRQTLRFSSAIHRNADTRHEFGPNQCAWPQAGHGPFSDTRETKLRCVLRVPIQDAH